MEEIVHKLVLTLVSAFSLVCVSGCATQRALLPDENIQTITYEVFGMDCPGCHGGVEKNLCKIPGVVKATANWKMKRVIIGVIAGETVAVNDIEDAIKKSNFTMGKRVD